MKDIKFWYQPMGFRAILLWPFSLIFGIVVRLRRWCYRWGILKVFHFPVPIIVVGNITVGGTGKTPLVIYLAKMLLEQGLYPGIVSRGYGVSKIKEPLAVTKDSDVTQVGDEALLIAKRVNCPIVVCADRVKAVDRLLQDHYCNVVISDDGLQHYRMGRDIEITVIDEERHLGNRLLLPAGPLREPVSRLHHVDFIVYNAIRPSLDRGENIVHMLLKSEGLIGVQDLSRHLAFEDLDARPIHAVAGIGNPDRFFNTLKQKGLSIIEHPYLDHHDFQFSDIDFDPDSYILMTEKDAVKCQSFADHRHWFLPVTAEIDHTLMDRLLIMIFDKLIALTEHQPPPAPPVIPLATVNAEMLKSFRGILELEGDQTHEKNT